MKRRDFLKVSSAAGLAGLAGPAYDALAAPGLGRETGFDLHPFIKDILKPYLLILPRLMKNK